MNVKPRSQGTPWSIHALSRATSSAVSRRPLRGHPEVGVVGRDPLDQLALAALAGDDGLRLEHRLARVERERALVFAVGVALGAIGP